MKQVLFLLFVFLILSCKNESNQIARVNINSEVKFDTIHISDFPTGNHILKSGFNNDEKLIELDYPILAKAYLKNTKKEYKFILEPSTSTEILIGKDSSITTKNIRDSLLNQLYDGNLNFINQRLSFVFETDNRDSLVSVFEEFRKSREHEIFKLRNNFSKEVYELLRFQNDALVYNFLFWLGRISQKLKSNDSFFNFIQNLPTPTGELKSFPKLYLEKFNIEYGRRHGALKGIEDFLRFLEYETSNEDLAYYLKAFYLKEIIQFPDFWQEHNDFLNSESLASIVKTENKNPYKGVYMDLLESFNSSQKGEIAYNFEAINLNEELFELSNFRKSVILIDVWATWCGPCIDKRPEIIDLAEKYSDNDDVKIVFISLDSKINKWQSFLSKNENQFGYDLFIEPENQEVFRTHYNTRLIPRYILINKKGIIIDANLENSLLAIEKAIERALENS